jgi:hypothetical protein
LPVCPASLFSLFSVSQVSIYAKPILRSLNAVIRQGSSIEAIKGLIAIQETLAADENLWSMIWFVIPMVISFGGLVIAVADSFDAMASDRPYRRVLSAQQAT